MKRRNFIWQSLLFVGGCTVATNSSNSTFNKVLDSAPKQLKFAVTDIKGLQDLQRDYGAFRTALEDVLDIKIDFIPVENTIAAAPALQLGQINLVLAGPSEYVILNARAKAIPVVALERPKYYSIVAVRANSGIKSLSQLKGKKIALRAKAGTGGHLYPTKLLMDAGLNPKSDYQSLFLEDKGLEALRKGDVDAWAVSISRYEKMLRKAGLSTTEFPIIATGSNLPSDVFVASSQLAPAFIQQMQQLMLKHQDKLIQAILASPENEKFKGSKMLAATDADYNMIREVYKAIGQGEFIS
ncbi:MAG: PhnD/SsuA/transferrin family substrate-binding protein [Fischerella sp.]|jgi:phosphonate transport system substrate-binding protein|uniref:PhnD/SsuA/transferrin family substrate-binding protein n=1 Tax=Fischerella sp. TaxID=1191 RepID=UPI0017CD46BE|nr:PhnD/SsuA/transferrin family substrate-binding protein [Fischerella sp.]NWF60214.1 PhnD/SsuA/transferrin family substrate-binding protein [Fischerella sp.]